MNKSDTLFRLTHYEQVPSPMNYACEGYEVLPDGIKEFSFAKKKN